jgi:hypothetical protein
MAPDIKSQALGVAVEGDFSSPTGVCHHPLLRNIAPRAVFGRTIQTCEGRPADDRRSYQGREAIGVTATDPRCRYRAIPARRSRCALDIKGTLENHEHDRYAVPALPVAKPDIQRWLGRRHNGALLVLQGNDRHLAVNCRFEPPPQGRQSAPGEAPAMRPLSRAPRNA